MSLKRLMLAVTSIVLAAPAAPAAFAAEGRIPLWQPQTISSPGKYFVSRNITVGCAVVFDIQADDVEIDLNGMVLESGCGSSDIIQGNAVDGLTVRNGTIIGGQNGISASGGAQITVEHVRFEGLSTAIRLTETGHFKIRHNIIRFADLRGIDIESTSDVTFVHGAIENNLVDASLNGIRVMTGRSVLISGNTIYATTNIAMEVIDTEASVIDGNSIDTTFDFEGVILQASSGNALTNNVVANAGDDGIFLDIDSNDNLIYNNSSNANNGAGLQVRGDRNHIEGNVFNSNDDYGLLLQSTANLNVYRRNTGMGDNLGLFICAAGVLPNATGRCDNGGFSSDNVSAGDSYMPVLL